MNRIVLKIMRISRGKPLALLFAGKLLLPLTPAHAMLTPALPRALFDSPPVVLCCNEKECRDCSGEEGVSRPTLEVLYSRGGTLCCADDDCSECHPDYLEDGRGFRVDLE